LGRRGKWGRLSDFDGGCSMRVRDMMMLAMRFQKGICSRR
jgi:hypothetical protein